jgi:DNA-binding transcriptional LysR family regulator
MREFADLERGELTVGAIPGLGVYWLPDFVSAFLRRYPGVNLRLIERSSSELFRLLDSQQIHAASVLLPADDSQVPAGIEVRVLSTRQLVVVVAPQHPLAHSSNVRLEDLAAERLVLTSRAEAPRTVMDRAFHAEGIEPFVWFEADDPSILIGVVTDGVAVGVTGPGIARRNADRVVALPLEGARLGYSTALAWSQRGPHTRALRAFLSFATTWLTSDLTRDAAEELAHLQS